jgi:L-alanine-DL-glutamate epimerase-like enolase superfamily enzyme
MKIKKITLWEVPLTSHATYYMAEGKTCDTVKSCILRIETSDGHSGWGEVCPIPHYLPAYASGVAPALQELAPVLLGAKALGPNALLLEMDKFLLDHRYAKSAIDIALWDILGKVTHQPVHTLLGGRVTRELPLYHSITCVDPDEMARIAKTAYQAGIRQFQAKLGADADWKADVERLKAVRDAVGNGPLVYGDWNCGATKLDAIRVGRSVSNLDIMLEQPCETIKDCGDVARATGLPMKQDETAHDFKSMLEASEQGCMDVVALKLSKFGGLTKSHAASKLAVQLGTKMCVECTWGSDVVTAASLHLASAIPTKFLLNTCDLSGYVSPRIASNAPERSKGIIVAPDGPGLGIEVDEDTLGKPTLILD